jgi:hypothetical protein
MYGKNPRGIALRFGSQPAALRSHIFTTHEIRHTRSEFSRVHARLLMPCLVRNRLDNSLRTCRTVHRHKAPHTILRSSSRFLAIAYAPGQLAHIVVKDRGASPSEPYAARS